ncbi:MAG: hypothetical protein QNK23_04825 [Crocinitomicaceae bacterium]|nr:hypothetical protein [Crocinitomicaceae bacterium]
MNLFDFVFRLGVLFAIYGFIWGIIDIGLRILSSGRKRSVNEVYVIKAIKYFVLVDVTFLFCIDGDLTGTVMANQVIFAGIILLTYFIGKLQKGQNKSMLFKFAGPGMPQTQKVFNLRAETTVIALALVIFALFWFFPTYARNPVSTWFSESITNIENTPIFGFIFKVIGFFFLLSLIFKMMSAFTFLINRGTRPTGDNNNGIDHDDRQNENHFDDYEEVD